MDAPLQRTLKIGKISVGLIGLDLALNRVFAHPDLSPEAAAGEVFAEVAAKNYIPDTAVERYKDALILEIMRLRGATVDGPGELEIRILGTGCVSCNNLQKLVIEIMADLGVAADVFQVHDPDEIGRFGVMRTPALVINREVKCAGRLPTRSEIEGWLREEG